MRENPRLAINGISSVWGYISWMDVFEEDTDRSVAESERVTSLATRSYICCALGGFLAHTLAGWI
jgi:hypothetical protein